MTWFVAHNKQKKGRDKVVVTLFCNKLSYSRLEKNQTNNIFI